MSSILRTLLVFVVLTAAGFAADDFAETKKKAEAGNADAQLALGLMYANGEGVIEGMSVRAVVDCADCYLSPWKIQISIC